MRRTSRAPRARFLAFAAPLLFLACSRGGPGSITSEELSEHVALLASDALRGRLTGTEEIVKAEEYIARAFEADGLRPLPGADGYFVDYTAWRQGYDATATSLVASIGGVPIAATLGADFRPFDFSGTGSVTAGLVFAGYGISAPEYDYDDYRGLDVRGKVVLLLRYEPNENDPSSSFAGTQSTTHAYFATKAKNAEAHGARGMLLFTTPLGHAPEEDLRAPAAYRLRPQELAELDQGPSGTFIALHVSQQFADSLARAAGTTIRDLQAAVDSGTGPAALALAGIEVTAAVVRAGAPEAVAARDVVGYIEGKRPDEMVLVGAHHDHIGSFPSGITGGTAEEPDTVYNGADDNASGVAGVLELAQAFGRRRARPERSIVFATFSGEEQYLLGAEALIESGLLSPSAISFMVNLDMIGRNPERPLEVLGTATGTDLRETAERASQALGLTLYYPPQLPDGMDSDQSVFARRGIPSLFLHTGLHDDFHGLDDEADRLDYEHIRLVTELAYRLLDERASR